MTKLPQAIAPEGFEATQFGFTDQVSAADIAAAHARSAGIAGAVDQPEPRPQVIGA